MCRPYRDKRLVSAQICSIIAAVPSVINLVPLSLSLLAVTWLQMICCFRVSKKNLHWLIFLSLITGVSIIVSGLFVPHGWGPYFLDEHNFTYTLVTCIISGFMWIIIAFKLIFFYESDYDRLEELLDAAASRQDNNNDSDDDSYGDDEVDMQTNRFEALSGEYNETAHAIRIFLEQREPSDLEVLSVATTEEGDSCVESIDPIEVQPPGEDSDHDDIEANIQVGITEEGSDCSCDIHAILETNTESTSTTARDSATSWTDDSSRRRSVAMEINGAGQIFHVSRSFAGEPGERNDGSVEDSVRGRSRTIEFERNVLKRRDALLYRTLKRENPE